MPAERAQMPTILIGCDPEFFIRNRETKKLVSCHDLIPGTKEAPFAVSGGAIQVDGVAAEINIVPASSGAQFVAYINEVTRALKSKLGDKYDIVREPVALFDEDTWKPLPDDTKMLGCNPDFNAWTKGVNDPPDDPDTFPKMRSAAGHIHIGWTKDRDINDPMHMSDAFAVARQMDYYLGLASLLIDHDPRRRTLYGKAGACRVKPYGVEYRTPSNVWTRSQQVQSWIWDAAFRGMRAVFEGHIAEEKFADFAQKAIDSNNINWLQSKDGQAVHGWMGGHLPPVPEHQLYPWTVKLKKEKITEVESLPMADSCPRVILNDEF